MKFIIELFLDGYENGADEEAACREFIEEHSSLRVISRIPDEDQPMSSDDIDEEEILKRKDELHHVKGKPREWWIEFDGHPYFDYSLSIRAVSGRPFETKYPGAEVIPVVEKRAVEELQKDIELITKANALFAEENLKLRAELKKILQDSECGDCLEIGKRMEEHFILKLTSLRAVADRMAEWFETAIREMNLLDQPIKSFEGALAEYRKVVGEEK